jgi:hypothetical protein
VEGHGRSQDERSAAREARERARIAREQGLSTDEEEFGSRPDEGDWDRPDLGSMSRYGGNLGNMDVYTKRRIVAVAIGLGVILILFLMVGGC